MSSEVEDWLTALTKLPMARLLRTPGVSVAQVLTEFFLQQARVAFSDGVAFGPGGDGFVRLNFGCPRSMLLEALERMKQVLT